VKGQAGILESDDPDEAQAKLALAVEAVVEDPSDHAWISSRLGPLVGITSQGGTFERQESFTAWRRFLEAVAEKSPLVLIFEDLHWADSALLAFVDHLVDYATGVPILVLCTARPELYEQTPAWGGGKRNATTIALSPLTDDETARLVSALLTDLVLPPGIQTALLERSGGNPLYAEEFVRMLIDQELIVGEGPDVRIVDGADISIPDTVQALIAARLDTVPPRRKALLHDASVVGKVFWSDAVASMEGAEETAVREGLHELARKELVRPARASSMRDQVEYSFWHALVRDVAYSQIPRASRGDKHRAAAEWIESMAGDRVADHAELLAYHYSMALELMPPSGEGRARLEELLARFLVLSGDRAMSLDVARADAFFRSALRALPGTHADRPYILKKAGMAAYLGGRLKEAEEDLRGAVSSLEAVGEILGAAEAMEILSRLVYDQGDRQAAYALIEAAVKLLEHEPATLGKARVYTTMAGQHMVAGDPADTVLWAERAMIIAREVGLEDLEARALEFRGMARCDLGDPGGIADLRLVQTNNFQDPQMAAIHNINLSDLTWLAETPAEGLRTLRGGIALSEKRGLTLDAMWARAESTWMLFDLGNWDELLEVADEVLMWAERTGSSQLVAIVHPHIARVRLLRGDLHEAAQLVEKFIPRAREIQDDQVIVPALAVAAMVQLEEGHVAEAAKFVEELADAIRDRPFFRCAHLPDAVRVLTETGRLDEARQLLSGIDPMHRRDRYSLLSSRALLAEAHGEMEHALELFGQAAGDWLDYGFVLEQSHALFGTGRCLLTLGRAAEAGQPLDQAVSLFDALGAKPLMKDVRSWLARIP
jgi:tetratricopeptide (TPR) repeat protein